MSTTPRIFEDGMSYCDKSTFIDYPVVKIRSYDKAESSLFKKIMLCTYVFVAITGLVFLFA